MEENKSEEIMNLTETKKNISKTKFLSKSKLLKNKFKKLSISGARKKGQKIVEIIQQNNKYENIPKIIKIRNTGVDVIRIIAMYSVVIHHLIYQFNGKTMQKTDVPKGHRIADSRRAALINYTEWIKFQKYAETHL